MPKKTKNAGNVTKLQTLLLLVSHTLRTRELELPLHHLFGSFSCAKTSMEALNFRLVPMRTNTPYLDSRLVSKTDILQQEAGSKPLCETSEWH